MKPFVLSFEIKGVQSRESKLSVIKILRRFNISMLKAVSFAEGEMFLFSDNFSDDKELKEELLVKLSRVEEVELLLFLSDNSTMGFSGSFENFCLSSPEELQTAQHSRSFREILGVVAREIEELEVKNGRRKHPQANDEVGPGEPGQADAAGS